MSSQTVPTTESQAFAEAGPRRRAAIAGDVSGRRAPLTDDDMAMAVYGLQALPPVRQPPFGLGDVLPWLFMAACAALSLLAPRGLV